MKIKQYLTVLIAAVFTLSSCSDFLEPVSESNFDETYVFSNAGDAKKMVMGVYALFTQDSYTSRMSNVWMQNTDVEVQAPSALPDGSWQILALLGRLLVP